MQFPDTEVTRETEAIMQAIAPFGTYSDTSKYNRAYSAIWTLLTDIEARPARPSSVPVGEQKQEEGV